MFPPYLQFLVPSLGRWTRMQETSIWQGIFNGKFMQREHAIKAYEALTAEVSSTAWRSNQYVYSSCIARVV